MARMQEAAVATAVVSAALGLTIASLALPVRQTLVEAVAALIPNRQLLPMVDLASSRSSMRARRCTLVAAWSRATDSLSTPSQQLETMSCSCSDALAEATQRTLRNQDVHPDM